MNASDASDADTNERRRRRSGVGGEGRSVNAVVLSAGRGSRLLPLTATRPKCLLPVGGKTIVEWQVQTLAACGIKRITVVVGFGAEQVEEVLAAQSLPGTEVRALFNPRFDVADNLISCWSARSEMESDFVLLNGDTLFEPGVLERVLESPQAPVAVAVCSKRSYDADDMKVHCQGTVLRQIGKQLPADKTDAESIGMLFFRGEGPRLFHAALDRAVTSPQAARQWYLSVVNEMAGENLVRTAAVDGLEWVEIDFHGDLRTAERMVGGWKAPERRIPARSAALPG
jgi:choline kinase